MICKFFIVNLLICMCSQKEQIIRILRWKWNVRQIGGIMSKNRIPLLKKYSAKPLKWISFPWPSHLILICYLKTVQTASFLISPQHQTSHLLFHLRLSLNILLCKDQRTVPSLQILRILNCIAQFYILAFKYFLFFL